MSRLSPDGRTLFADAEEVRLFFEEHRITGRVIKDIRPARLDYVIANLCDFDEETILGWNAPDGIQMDGQICLLFEDGDSLEIELPGGAPLILGFNTAELEKYPEYNGKCYRLSTMFPWILGKKIAGAEVRERKYGMDFPSYKGVDMSGEGNGISEVELLLEDGSGMRFWGWLDFAEMECWTADGGESPVPFAELWNELSEDYRRSLLDDSWLEED